MGVIPIPTELAFNRMDLWQQGLVKVKGAKISNFLKFIKINKKNKITNQKKERKQL